MSVATTIEKQTLLAKFYLLLIIKLQFMFDNKTSNCEIKKAKACLKLFMFFLSIWMKYETAENFFCLFGKKIETFSAKFALNLLSKFALKGDFYRVLLTRWGFLKIFVFLYFIYIYWNVVLVTTNNFQIFVSN